MFDVSCVCFALASSEQVGEMLEALRVSQSQQAEHIALMMKLFADQSKDKEERPPNMNPEEGSGTLRTKTFMGIDNLERKEQWDDWAWNMKLKVKALNKEFGALIDEAEKASDKGIGDVQDKCVGDQRDQELYGILSERVTGEALKHVRATEEGHGLMAWRSI